MALLDFSLDLRMLRFQWWCRGSLSLTCFCHIFCLDSGPKVIHSHSKQKSRNVNPGLLDPKRLFNWGGTISVAIYHYLGEPPQFINQGWHSSGMDINWDKFGWCLPSGGETIQRWKIAQWPRFGGSAATSTGGRTWSTELTAQRWLSLPAPGWRRHKEVSTPKSSILIGFSTIESINHPFRGTPMTMEPPNNHQTSA